ncbi:MAG: hypothetical protein K6C32_04895, partial [Bacilli bacterium]|nr:hypothetical protein [Bacilli bacterium]
DGDGFVATKVINGRLYSFVYTFNAADETLSFRYDQEPTSYVFTSWFADFINTEFLTKKSLTTAIPELPLDGAEQYVVDLTLDDFFSYDNVQIVISGDHSTAWAAALTGGNYVVETDENGDTYYLSADGKIAIYSDYDEDSDSTYAIIYATADFEE